MCLCTCLVDGWVGLFVVVECVHVDRTVDGRVVLSQLHSRRHHRQVRYHLTQQLIVCGGHPTPGPRVRCPRQSQQTPDGINK